MVSNPYEELEDRLAENGAHVRRLFIAGPARNSWLEEQVEVVFRV